MYVTCCVRGDCHVVVSSMSVYLGTCSRIRETFSSHPCPNRSLVFPRFRMPGVGVSVRRKTHWTIFSTTLLRIRLTVINMARQLVLAIFMVFISMGLLHLSLSLQHSAMWQLDDATVDDNAAFMTLTFDVSNLTMISRNAELGVKALYPLSWTVPQSHKYERALGLRPIL